MQAKIQKWGNYLALRIPRSLAIEAGVEAGSLVRLSIRRGELIVSPSRRKILRLKELLRKTTHENIQAEVDTAAPVGREIG